MAETASHIIARHLTAISGLALEGEPLELDEEIGIRIAPSDLHANESFAIEPVAEWRSVTSRFVPGSYAAALLKEMSEASEDQKRLFEELSTSIRARGGNVGITINGSIANPVESSTWPQNWNSYEAKVSSGYLDKMAEDPTLSVVTALLGEWAGITLALMMSIIPLEEDGKLSDMQIADEEGGQYQVLVTRYERSRRNRTACLAFYGDACLVCGRNLRHEYGQIGDGIVHVHHVVPVSELGDGYQVDPIADLVPLCPNCHIMIHRSDPPFSVDELKDIRDRQRESFTSN